MQDLDAISKMTEWSLFISNTSHSISQSSKSMPWPVTLKSWRWTFYEDLQDLLELTPPKNVLFIIGDWKAKVGSQETPGVTGKFGLGVQNEAGQMLIEFCQEKALVIANTLFQQHKRRLYTWTSPDGQHRKQIDYIFAAKDKEALYSQEKQDWELTVALIMNSLLPNSDLSWRKCRKQLYHSGMT